MFNKKMNIKCLIKMAAMQLTTILQQATVLPNEVIGIINEYCQNEIYYAKYRGAYGCDRRRDAFGYYLDGKFFTENLPNKRCHSVALINNIYCKIIQWYVGTVNLYTLDDKVIVNWPQFGPDYINKIVVTNYIYIDYGRCDISKYSINVDFTLKYVHSILTGEKLQYANDKYVITSSRTSHSHIIIYDTNFAYIKTVPFKLGMHNNLCCVDNCLISYQTDSNQLDYYDLNRLNCLKN